MRELKIIFPYFSHGTKGYKKAIEKRANLKKCFNVLSFDVLENTSALINKKTVFLCMVWVGREGGGWGSA